MSTGIVLLAANEKGGVGKTVTAVNVAAALAHSGKRVVAIDGDSQADLTWQFGVDPDADGGEGLAEAVELASNSRRVPDSLLRSTATPGLRVLAGGNGLAAIAKALYERDEIGEGWVRDVARDIAARPDVDVVVFDAPPSPGPVTLGALLAADLTLAVANARQANSVAALATLHDRAAATRTRGGHTRVAVVLQGYDSRRVLHVEMRVLLTEQHGKLLGVIPHSKHVEESPTDGVPLVLMRGRNDTPTAVALYDLAANALALAQDHESVPA